MQKKGLMVHSLRKPWSLLVPPHPPLQATQEYGGGGLWNMDKTLTRSPPLTLSMGWAVATAPPVCSQIQCQ